VTVKRRWARAARCLREPLLHFLLLGVLLFVVHAWVAPADKAGQRIVVGSALVDELARQYRSVWMRPPTAQELDGLVEAWVRDEILYREGLALGLDRDDAVIKRRVRQKLEVIAEEQLARSAPGEAELAAYLADNSARFARPAVVSFEQIMFDASASPSQIERAVAAAHVALARGAASDTLGQRTILPPVQAQVPLDQVARDFGRDFAERLSQLPLGEWAGPIPSGLGVHLVRLSARSPAAVPPLEAVRSQVAREWENAQRERSRAENYRQLRAGYEVVRESPQAVTAASKP
jgi:parvulin-like peptidyl-prolyl isomerase